MKHVGPASNQAGSHLRLPAMILSNHSVVHYLMEQGLLPGEAVVNGDVLVLESSRRNRNFKIIRHESPGLFVKQIQTWDPQSTSGLQREALCYWMAAKDRGFAPLGDIMPKYRHYDPARSILVTELCKDGESLAEHHQRTGKFPPQVAAKLGAALGRYHKCGAAEILKSPYRGAFPKAVPWILSLHNQTSGIFANVSAGNGQMIGILKRYPEFQKQFDALRECWKSECLIHGDMKWDNCLLDPQSPGEGLWVVDWELADVGDPGWDIGAVFQAYLSYWIGSLPMVEGGSVQKMIDNAPFPLESTHPALRSFVAAYQQTRQLRAPDWPELLERSSKFAAARMVQTVYEYMHQSEQLTGTALCLLQTSYNMLCRTKEAQHELLGL